MKSLAIRPAIGTGLLLLIPLVMSTLDRHKPAGDGWHWGPMDFVVMGVLLFGAGLAYEYFASRLGDRRHRVLLGAALRGQLTESLALSVGYRGRMGDSFDSHLGGVELSLRF